MEYSVGLKSNVKLRDGSSCSLGALTARRQSHKRFYIADDVFNIADDVFDLYSISICSFVEGHQFIQETSRKRENARVRTV
jgi:hypothetical protein